MTITHGTSASCGLRTAAWLAGAYLVLMPIAYAQEPAAAPNAQALAIAEGMVNYCAPIDPAAADKVRQLIKQLMQGASEQQLVEVRKSDEYRKAYDSVGDFTAKIDPRNAKKFCSESPLAHR